MDLIILLSVECYGVFFTNLGLFTEKETNLLPGKKTLCNLFPLGGWERNVCV
jgi:hypothetical protein